MSPLRNKQLFSQLEPMRLTEGRLSICAQGLGVKYPSKSAACCGPFQLLSFIAKLLLCSKGMIPALLPDQDNNRTAVSYCSIALPQL